MSLHIRHRMDAIHPHHHAGLTPYILRAPGVAGRMPLAHPDPVAGREPRLRQIATGVGHQRGEYRPAQRKPPARARLQLGMSHQPVLHRQRGRRGEPVLVVARCQVVARLHPLDRVPELSPARLHRADDDLHQCPGHRLPPAAKGGLSRRMANRPEALHAAQVMNAIHQPDITRLPLGGRSERAAPWQHRTFHRRALTGGFIEVAVHAERPMSARFSMKAGHAM